MIIFASQNLCWTVPDLVFYLSWSWSWAVYKVYGTFILVLGLDLGTSGLKPNTDVRGQ